MSEVTARALASSSLHVNAMQIVQMVSRLVLTPIVIARLGLEGYGVWVLLFTVCGSATAINTASIGPTSRSPRSSTNAETTDC